MRALNRNKRTLWYCLYEDEEPQYDEYGNETGETRAVYSEATMMRANVSPASGSAQTEFFGTVENYDKVIVTDWMDCPLDENSVLFIDKQPEHNLDGDPMPDYKVWRVAKSLNSVSIAVKRVSVS